MKRRQGVGDILPKEQNALACSIFRNEQRLDKTNGHESEVLNKDHAKQRHVREGHHQRTQGTRTCCENLTAYLLFEEVALLDR